MSFTAGELQAIKAAINGNSAALADWNAGNPGAAAEWLNSASATLIWMPAVPVSVLLTGVVWSAFIALSTSQQAAWQALTAGGTVDATNANIRAGFTSIFGAGSQTLTNLAALAQRAATNLEALFTTSGVCSLYGAMATEADVRAAMAS